MKRRVLVLVALASLAGCRKPERPNVVLVVIDTLRRDHLSGLGHERPTSPGLDRLIGEGVLFENLVSTSSQTVPAVASLLTGLYPSETSVQYYGKKSSFDGERPWSEVGPHFDSSLTSLAERLQSAGYRTAAVVSNPWLKPEFGFDQGFESYVSLDCGDECDGKNIVREGLSWLSKESSRAPFFLYLHFMDVHSPYRKKGITERVFVEKRGIDRYRNGPVPPELRPRDLDYMKALYDEGVLRVDGHLDSFLGELDRYSRESARSSWSSPTTGRVRGARRPRPRHDALRGARGEFSPSPLSGEACPQTDFGRGEPGRRRAHYPRARGCRRARLRLRREPRLLARQQARWLGPSALLRARKLEVRSQG